MRSLLPMFVLAVTVVSVYAFRRRERRRWENRKISGGRKALVLNLYDRD